MKQYNKNVAKLTKKYKLALKMTTDLQKATLYLGLAYVTIGVFFWVTIGFRSFTPLIPAIPGLVFIFLGLLAKKNTLRKHVLHVAMVFGVICSFMVVMAIRRIAPYFDPSVGEIKRPLAATEMLIAGSLAIVYVFFGVRGFIAARKK